VSLEDELEGSKGAEDGAERAAEATKLAAAAAVGRIVALGALREHRDWLAARLVSHLAAHGERVDGAIKELCRCVLRRRSAAAAPLPWARRAVLAFLALVPLAPFTAAPGPGAVQC
jgi:hypothetical protein